MSWLWISLGIVLLLVLTPFVAGRFMARDFAAAGETVVPRPIDEVWGAMQDSTRFPISARMTRSSERLPDVDGQVAWREDIGSSKINYRVLESSAPTRRVIEGRDAIVPMTMHSTYELTAVEGGTRVRAETQVHLDDGTWHVPVFRFLMTVTGGVQSGLNQYLESLNRIGK
jgi:hypothetical protein